MILAVTRITLDAESRRGLWRGIKNAIVFSIPLWLVLFWSIASWLK